MSLKEVDSDLSNYEYGFKKYLEFLIMIATDS